jgi:hypothetical protein
MSRFIGYELAPASEASGEVSAHDDEASARATGAGWFWSLYGRDVDGTVICIGDFRSFDSAADIYHRITGHAKPINSELRRLRRLAA